MEEAATIASLDNNLCAHCERNIIVNTITGQHRFGVFCSADCHSLATRKSQPHQSHRPPPIEIPKAVYYAPAHIIEASPQ